MRITLKYGGSPDGKRINTDLHQIYIELHLHWFVHPIWLPIAAKKSLYSRMRNTEPDQELENNVRGYRDNEARKNEVE